MEIPKTATSMDGWLQRCRESRKLVLIIVAIALLLDNMLLTTVGKKTFLSNSVFSFSLSLLLGAQVSNFPQILFLASVDLCPMSQHREGLKFHKRVYLAKGTPYEIINNTVR